MNVAMLLVLLLAAARLSCAGEEQLEPKDNLPPAPPGKAWKLIWHDEFDGDKLDEKKWDIPEYKRHDAHWSRKAIALDGQGHLAIKT
ncbi:MAG: hypothetical protein ABSE73_10230, partial [Planctomycetota bacterium]